MPLNAKFSVLRTGLINADTPKDLNFSCGTCASVIAYPSKYSQREAKHTEASILETLCPQLTMI